MSVAEAYPARSRAEQDLEGLYQRHADRIFGFCRNRLRTHQEAEDAVQTTFLQAFRALQRGTVPISETAWLFKIAENVCLSAHRTNGRRSERELADGGEVVELAPAREARDDALFGLEEALATIPENQRRAFVLRELRGLSYKEIAGVAGLSVTAVEMLVFRARRSLAQALESGALKGRVASVLDLGAAMHAIKTALGGASVAKVVSAAVVVAIATVPAGDSPAPAADRPMTVRTEAYEQPRESERAPSALRETRAGTPSERSARRAAAAASGASSDAAAGPGIPNPQRGPIEDEGSAPTENPAAADPPAENATPPAENATPPGVPAESVPAPAIEPRVPDPVQLPSTPTISEPSVPALPVEAPKLPVEAPIPPELPVKLPEPPKVELPALPTVP